MHVYTKAMFPALREARFVHRHRGAGHKVLHYTAGRLARCYWRCSCGKRYWC